ncbi:hypothetical protein KBD71_00975 [Candidatus Woesebacteria bacterium]|nr:hypothetical protein [Candidatus Woesebacteria bacterium]
MSEKSPRYIILHGCPPSEAMVTPKEKRWMNWLANKLNERGLSSVALDLPVSWEPKYSIWKEEFEKYLVTANSILIGHSCRAAF